MKATSLLKILFLIGILVVVIGVIRGLKGENVQKAFDAMGIEVGAPGSPGFQPAGRALKPGEEHFSICPTRIHAIEWEGGRKIEEHKDGLNLKWMAYDPTPREVGYLEVEKWLSRHCQIIVRAVGPEKVAGQTERTGLTIRYIDGLEKKVTRINGHFFDFGGQILESEDFAQALKELQEF